MDPDLPLMDMAEADESLVLQFPDPNQTPSKSSLSFFTCSPLAFPLSNTKSLKDSAGMEKPSSSSSEASNNKKNLNCNNVEVPKLGMKPLQMKTRKKDGGYNLRKSLAWDRAFFTDEGILDPVELTLITGINASTLPTISEEGNTNSSCSSACKSKGKKACKEALPKKLHDKRCTSKGNKVGNHDSSPHHKVTHTINRTNKSGSKVGSCSVPLASSLKRPANLNIMKTSHQESKLPKPNQLRHKLIPKPTINVQRNVGLKNLQIKGKTCLPLPAKEPAQKATNSSSKAASSTKSQVVHVNTTNSGSEIVPELSEVQENSILLTKNHTTTNSNKSLTEADRLHVNKGVYSQSIQPSGLRMPSPSLRFFDQKTGDKKNEDCKTKMRAVCVKKNDIKENICCVSDYNIERKNVDNIYECKGSEFEVDFCERKERVENDSLSKDREKYKEGEIRNRKSKIQREKNSCSQEEHEQSENEKQNKNNNVFAGEEESSSSSFEREKCPDPQQNSKADLNGDGVVVEAQGNNNTNRFPNALPFSDEWLAAIEAAGEEILTIKCGAVQHSPPHKSLSQPGPWSPVKKKPNQIGPYDCTKYINQ